MTDQSLSERRPRAGDAGTDRAPLSHGVCLRCWPVPTQAAIAMCGELAWPAGTTPHWCDYPTFRCGCIPCVVCVDFQEGACPVCGNANRLTS